MKNLSIWQNQDKKTFPQLKGEVTTDVLIIGGGMAGILCANELEKAGVGYVLVEGNEIGQGTSGHTTAKITAQHGAVYHKLMSKFGDEFAKRYYDVNSLAVEKYKELAAEIPCDYEEKTAYTYGTSTPEVLDKEEKAYRNMGCKGIRVENPPLPIKTCGALGMEKQGQLNPLKLIYGLAEGLNIYENTFVKEIDGHLAITDQARIHGRYIIFATHFPVVNVPGAYFVKLYQHRSYVVALENGQNVDGMFMDESKTGYSFRNYHNYLLIGGGAHKTGYGGRGDLDLQELAKSAYPDKKIAYSWAAQDCMSLDGVPYIGVHRKSTPHILVATGFNKWGMTGSMVAATVLKDMISKDKSDYENLFSPQRSMLSGQLAVNLGSAVFNMVRFNKRCSHLGCALKWNKYEQTWDCPCHGSRFEKDGANLENPATRPIK